MLKALFFVFVAVCAARDIAAAQELPRLIVGNVREPDGRAVTDATVAALDAAGRSIVRAATDREGTFALDIPQGERPAAVEVRCRFCRAARSTLAREGDPVTIFVVRDRALSSTLPTGEDVAALPYPRVDEVLALAPLTLSQNTTISDRGLGGGRSLVVDDGAPIADAATRADSALADFPDRSATSLARIDPLQAFRYGPHAAGGGYEIDTFAEGSRGFADAGTSHDLAALARAGALAVGVALSGDAGTTNRRADLDLATTAFGGALRAGYGADGASGAGANGAPLARNVEISRLAYATASRRYVTTVDASFADSGVDIGGANADRYRSQYASAAFRLEHPGPIALGFTARGTFQSARYAFASPTDSYRLDGRLGDQTLALDASTASGAGSLALGLGYTRVSERGTLANGRLAGDRGALVPSVDGSLSLGDGFALHAGYAGALDVPTLVEANAIAAYRTTTFALARTALSEAALRFDDGARVRFEAGVFRGVEGASATPSVAGVGTALVWQLAANLDVRAWSLLGSTSRTVLWTTYGNPLGVRFDAIARDEPATLAARRATRFDVGTLVPIAPHVGLALGSVERNGGRSITLGLRER